MPPARTPVDEEEPEEETPAEEPAEPEVPPATPETPETPALPEEPAQPEEPADNPADEGTPPEGEGEPAAPEAGDHPQGRRPLGTALGRGDIRPCQAAPPLRRAVCGKEHDGGRSLPPSPLLWDSKPGEGVLLSARCFLAGGESETLPRQTPWERRGAAAPGPSAGRGYAPTRASSTLAADRAKRGPGQGFLQGVAVAAHLHQQGALGELLVEPGGAQGDGKGPGRARGSSSPAGSPWPGPGAPSSLGRWPRHRRCPPGA